MHSKFEYENYTNRRHQLRRTYQHHNRQKVSGNRRLGAWLTTMEYEDPDKDEGENDNEETD